MSRKAVNNEALPEGWQEVKLGDNGCEWHKYGLYYVGSLNL